MDSIAFPHLGIAFAHVGQDFSVFGVRIAYYGIAIALAMLAGTSLVLWLAGRTGQDPDQYYEYILVTLILAVIGARLYYVVFSWDYYRHHPLEILILRRGGLAIYGGILTGMAVTVITSRRKGMPLLRMMDTAAPGVVLGQGIGRWGNFFNREAFGGYTDSLFAMRLPLARLAEGDVTNAMREHVIVLDGIPMVQVHPTFLYETLLDVTIAAVCTAAALRLSGGKPGKVFGLYLLLYGTGRFFIEGLRTDQLLLWGSRIPVSQAVSVAFALAGALLLTERSHVWR